MAGSVKSEQPRSDTSAVWRVGRSAPPKRHKRVLTDLLGRRRIPKHAEGEAKLDRSMSIIETPHGYLFLGAQVPHPLGIGVRDYTALVANGHGVHPLCARVFGRESGVEHHLGVQRRPRQ